jgi:hypothetical protein
MAIVVLKAQVLGQMTGTANSYALLSHWLLLRRPSSTVFAETRMLAIRRSELELWDNVKSAERSVEC